MRFPHISLPRHFLRDRVAQHYSGRTSASRVLRALVGKSVFVEESSRKVMDEEGNVDRDKLLAMIMSSIEEADIDVRAEKSKKHPVVSRQSRNASRFPVSGWAAETRMVCLEELDRTGPPTDSWGKFPLDGARTDVYCKPDADGERK